MPDASMQHLPRLGRYQVLRKIAEGGMAEIFLAKSLGAMGFERLVAIKLIRPHLTEDSDFVKMFLDEARISLHLQHRNIVQTFDLEKANGTYFIAMEYVHGINVYDLYERIAEKGQWIDLSVALYIMCEACKGLHFAHTQTDPQGTSLGIVHRDVSPQNILLSFEGEVKIMDFGIAKATERLHETMPGIVKGKYAYMAPEILHDQEADGRVDVFAAGVVLYELLTRENPFAGNNAVDTIEAVLGKKVVPPTEKCGVGSRALDAIVLKALAKKPEQRFQSARALSDALTDHGLSLTGARWDIAAGDSSVSNLLRELFPKKASQAFHPSSVEHVVIPQALAAHDQDSALEVSPAGKITDAGNYAAQETLLRVAVEKGEDNSPPREECEEAQTALTLDPNPLGQVQNEQKDSTTANTLPPEPETDLSLPTISERQAEEAEARTQLQDGFLGEQVALDSLVPQQPVELQDRGTTQAPRTPEKKNAGFVDPTGDERLELKFNEQTPEAVEALSHRNAPRKTVERTTLSEGERTAPPQQQNSPLIRTASFPEAELSIPDAPKAENKNPPAKQKKTQAFTALVSTAVAIMFVVILFTIVFMSSNSVTMVSVPVTSRPSGATVVINGMIQSNKTPLSAIVPSGRRHRIEISAPGYKTFSKDIDPQAGSKIQINAILSIK